jgi:hypothetical protein
MNIEFKFIYFYFPLNHNTFPLEDSPHTASRPDITQP